MLPTWISALAYGQAMAIRIFSGMFFSSLTPSPSTRTGTRPGGRGVGIRETKLPAFASSVIRRQEPSRSSSGVELQLEAGHHHTVSVIMGCSLLCTAFCGKWNSLFLAHSAFPFLFQLQFTRALPGIQRQEIRHQVVKTGAFIQHGEVTGFLQHNLVNKYPAWT